MSTFFGSYPSSGSGSSGVTSLNTLTGALTLAAGSGITITPSGGDTLTIASTGGSPAGSSGAVQFNESSAFAADSSNFFWDNTAKRLGIGTASPSTSLHVSHSSSGLITVDNTSSDTVFLRAATATTTSASSSVGTSTNTDFSIRTNNAPQIYITAAGAVGIGLGTNSPRKPLEVTAAESLFLSGQTGADGGLDIQAAGSGANLQGTNGALDTAIPVLINGSFKIGADGTPFVKGPSLAGASVGYVLTLQNTSTGEVAYQAGGGGLSAPFSASSVSSSDYGTTDAFHIAGNISDPNAWFGSPDDAGVGSSVGTRSVAVSPGAITNATSSGDVGTLQLTGSTNLGTGAAGEIDITGGYAQTQVGGNVVITGGGSGAAVAGGDIILAPGQGSSATKGVIKLQATSPTVGYVWTATNADGSGDWMAAGGGGLSAPLEALTSYTPAANNASSFHPPGVGTFLGNDSDNDQTHKQVVFGSTDTAIDTNFASNVYIIAGDNTNNAVTSGGCGSVIIQAGSIANGGSGDGGSVIIQSGYADSGAQGHIAINSDSTLTLKSLTGITMKLGGSAPIANSAVIISAAGLLSSTNILLAPDNNPSVDYGTRKLYADVSSLSVDYNGRLLYDAGGTNIAQSWASQSGSGRPSTVGVAVGYFFFDTSLAAGNGKPIWWNGTIWVDAAGIAA